MLSTNQAAGFVRLIRPLAIRLPLEPLPLANQAEAWFVQLHRSIACSGGFYSWSYFSQYEIVTHPPPKGDDILFVVLLFAAPVSSLLTLFSSAKTKGGWAFILNEKTHSRNKSAGFAMFADVFSDDYGIVKYHDHEPRDPY